MPRPLALKSKNRKGPDLGPKVRVETARVSPAASDSALVAVFNGAGLQDSDKDGLREHDNAPKSMWLEPRASDLSLEFELPAPVPPAAIEVWNYNREWQTTNGLRKADLAVSADGRAWKTVQRGVELAEADGRSDYDEPIVLKLEGVTAQKVRFENVSSWGSGGEIG